MARRACGRQPVWPCKLALPQHALARNTAPRHLLPSSTAWPCLILQPKHAFPRCAGSLASFSSLLGALQHQSGMGGPALDEQTLLDLKREQLLQQYSGMGPLPGELVV